MIAVAIAWLVGPFVAAFLSALLPRLGRPLALLASSATVAMAVAAHQGHAPTSLQLLGPLGVSLQLDGVASPFLLLNALVIAAAVLEHWGGNGKHVGQPITADKRLPLLLLVLLGALNSAIVAVDLISIYVALEVVGLVVVLLLALGNGEQDLWLAMRYGLVNNTVMLLFLVGAALVYLDQGSFSLAAAGPAGGVPLALMAMALVTKAELFVAGLWLPRTNAQAPPLVSAVLSGTVVCAGVVPLLRLAEVAPALQPVLQGLGILCAALGVVFALAEPDLRRLLAWSTLSQMGLVVMLPSAGGLMALGNGLAKAALFLAIRPDTDPELAGWRQRPLAAVFAVPMLFASLSIAGVPPFLGFLAKNQLEGGLTAPAAPLVALLAVGTVAVYARLWGAPLAPKTSTPQGPRQLGAPLLAAALLLLNFSPWGAPLWRHLLSNNQTGGGLAGPLLKAAATLATGVALQRALETRGRPWRLPDLERLDDLLAAAVVLGAALVLVLAP